jgi:hypothetical protein
VRTLLDPDDKDARGLELFFVDSTGGGEKRPLRRWRHFGFQNVLQVR